MIRVAIVEDDTIYSKTMQNYLEQYQREREQTFKVTTFDNAIVFLSQNKETYDIVLMDIDMPHMNGLEAARKLREQDKKACLIFVTSLAKYAIKGYEVDAMDFVVKPVSYALIALKLDKAVGVVQKNRQDEVVLDVERGVRRIAVSDIYYVEVDKHQLSYHTKEGIYQVWGTMAGAEKQLNDHSFSRCNVSYLVNLQHVTEVDGEYVTVANEKLKISRQKKKDFVNDLMGYLGKE